MSNLSLPTPHYYHALLSHPYNESILTWKTDSGLKLPIIAAINGTNYDQFRMFAQHLITNDVPINLVRIVKNSILVFEFPFGDEPLIAGPLMWLKKESVTEINVDPPSTTLTEYLQKYTVDGLRVDAQELHDYNLPRWYNAASTWSKLGVQEIGHHFFGLKRLNSSFERAESRVKAQLGTTVMMIAFGRSFMHEEIWTLRALCTHLGPFFMANLPFKVDFIRQWVLVPDVHILEPNNVQKGPEVLKLVLKNWGEIQKSAIRVRFLLENGRRESPKSKVQALDMEEMTRRAYLMLENHEWVQKKILGIQQEGKEAYSITEFKNTYLTVLGNIWSLINEYKIPSTLVHGDLSERNIVKFRKRNGDLDVHFLNYGNTCISHPFVDAVTVCKDMCGKIDSTILGEYFEYWKDFERKERMIDLVHIVEDLCTIILHLQRHYKRVHGSELNQDFSEVQENSDLLALFEKYGGTLASF